jgi:two-component system, OmpR family, phosphate regulon sensor histidine kinase PhoR
MFQAKNLSPKKLSLFTALALSAPIALGIYFLEDNWKVGLVSFGLIFIGSYILLLSIIQNFIYRKIKLIYKFILPQKSIDDVREDVEAWALQRSKEVELLKENEVYRREFLQNLSHEVKTPVFAIQGYIDTLLQGAMENPETNKRFLQKASKNVDRLVSLIQDLDQISKLERGELQLNKSGFFIQDLVKEVFESLSFKAEANNISFSFKKGCETPLTVYADKEKVRQVLTNLVDNSIKYGKYGGSVVASMYNTDDTKVLVEISDDGMGIAEKNLDRIFERFYRTEEGRSRDVTGSGLGLSICKHIIEAHGNTIHVRSKEDVGTTIGFTLDSKNAAS